MREGEDCKTESSCVYFRTEVGHFASFMVTINFILLERTSSRSVYTLRHCHRPGQSLSLCQWLTGRMGLEPILPITIGTMINLDGDGVRMCKQTLTWLNRVTAKTHLVSGHFVMLFYSCFRQDLSKTSQLEYLRQRMITSQYRQRRRYQNGIPVQTSKSEWRTCESS